jgi:hypothetical protein
LSFIAQATNPAIINNDFQSTLLPTYNHSSSTLPQPDHHSITLLLALGPASIISQQLQQTFGCRPGIHISKLRLSAIEAVLRSSSQVSSHITHRLSVISILHQQLPPSNHHLKPFSSIGQKCGNSTEFSASSCFHQLVKSVEIPQASLLH